MNDHPHPETIALLVAMLVSTLRDLDLSAEVSGAGIPVEEGV